MICRSRARSAFLRGRTPVTAVVAAGITPLVTAAAVLPITAKKTIACAAVAGAEVPDGGSPVSTTDLPADGGAAALDGWPRPDASAPADGGVLPLSSPATPPAGATPLMRTPATTSAPPPGPESAAAADARFSEGVLEVRVRKRGHLESKDVLPSVSIVGRSQIKNESVAEPLNLIRRMPGVFLQEFNQGVISGDLGLRGFNPQGNVAPVKLIIDGVPSNLHIGFADMKPIFPMEIDRVELVRGTNDPRYGLYAVAGNLHVFTQRGGSSNRFRGTAGTFNTYEAQASSAIETDNFTQNLFGAFRYTRGYRDHAESQKYAMSGKWFYKLGDRLRAGVIGRMFRMDADAPGYLTEAQAAQSPTVSPAFSGTDGGIQSNRHGSIHLEWEPRRNLFWSLRSYHQTVQRRRWVRFTEAGAQQERYEWEKQTGALTQLTYRPGGLGMVEDLSFSAGANLEYQDNVFRRFVTENRNRVMATRDQTFDLLNVGAFVQADVRLSRWLRLTGGLRWDRLDGNMRNLLTGAAPAPMIAFGNIWQPKMTAVVTPVAGYNLYASFGRSFQVPVRDSLYAQRAGLTWSKNDGWETGAKFQPLGWLTTRATYWRQTASDEISLRLNSTTDVENVGETLRHGLDLEAGVNPHAMVSLWASFTYQRTRIIDPGANTPELRGIELSHVPRHLFKSGFELRPVAPLVASLWIFSEGEYSLTDPTNYLAITPASRFGGYTLVNLDAGYSWRSVRFGGHVRNLFGTEWGATVFNDGSTTLISPGDARQFLASVETAF